MLKYMTSKVHEQFHPTNIFFIMMLLVLLVTLYPPENPPANPQNSVSGYLWLIMAQVASQITKKAILFVAKATVAWRG